MITEAANAACRRASNRGPEGFELAATIVKVQVADLVYLLVDAGQDH